MFLLQLAEKYIVYISFSRKSVICTKVPDRKAIRQDLLFPIQFRTMHSMLCEDQFYLCKLSDINVGLLPGAYLFLNKYFLVLV